MDKTSSNEIVLVIVPASGEEARRHFSRTVEKRWSLSDILNLGVDLPDELKKKLEQVEEFAIWGSTPRVRGIRRLFEMLEKGSEGYVAFYRDNRIVCWGRIFAWIHNDVLARLLWGQDKHGDTWEYIYFIRDLRCPKNGIPWDAVRGKLGYKQSFLPRGHTFVWTDKLKNIIEEYGDLISFFESLSKTSLDRNVEKTQIVKSISSHKYNPYVILSLQQLDPETLLHVLGKIAWFLRHSENKQFSKKYIEEKLGEILRNAGLKLTTIRSIASEEGPLLLNDLRRIGVIEAGDPLSIWPGNVNAKATILAYRAANAVDYCKKVCENVDKCFTWGGAIIIIDLLGEVSVGSPKLRETLKRLYKGEGLEGIAKEITVNVGATDVKRMANILDAMKTLINKSVEALLDAIRLGCIPRFYVPLNIAPTPKTRP